MRFNSKELAALALQPSHKFDKEGPLLVREKQEGLFRRSEISIERWCRLRGNMLFYFKSGDQYSEPAGIIILEQCHVQLDAVGDEGPYSFSIVFDSDVGCIQLCALSEAERDAWIQALHMASYEYMRTQLRALNEKIDEKNRRVDDGHTSSPKAKVLADFTEGSYLEMSFACDNLMCDGDGQPPNPVVVLSLVSPERGQWTTYAQTEFIERTSNPCFLTTINFRLSDIQVSGTKIKLSVYDVRERLTSTMTLLGSALFSVDDLDLSDTFRLTLTSGVGISVGFITITAWFVTISDPCTPSTLASANQRSSPRISLNKKAAVAIKHRSTSASAVGCSSASSSPAAADTRAHPTKATNSNWGNLNVLFDNVVSQSYRFHTGLGADLSVQEIMAECKLGFSFPQSIIQLFIRDEKQLLHFLSGIGELKEEWSKRQADLIERRLHLINVYTIALQNLDSSSGLGTNFKPSCEKNNSELEFVPVNFHLQRISVHNDSIKKSATYDVFTVGAFAAHSRRFRNGGLHRILCQLKPHRDDKVSTAAEAVARIKQLKTSLESLTDELLRLAGHQTSSAMCLTMTDISTKAHQLIGICDPSLVEEASTLIDGMSMPKTVEVVDLHQVDVAASNDNQFGRTPALPPPSPRPPIAAAPVRQMEIGTSPKRHSKERSKSLDGHQLSALFHSQPLQVESSTNMLMLANANVNSNITSNIASNTKKSDYKKEYGSPRSGRRRSLRPVIMTRHGSLKEENKLHLQQQQQQQLDNQQIHLHHLNQHQHHHHQRTLSSHDRDIRFAAKKLPSSESTSKLLVMVNNAKNEDIGGSGGGGGGETLARCKSPDEPEPWDLTQLNIEASVMCMASKVKSLCRSVASRDRVDADVENIGRGSGAGSSFDEESRRLSTKSDWVLELRPSVRKLNQALDCLWRTANTMHAAYLLVEPLQSSIQQGVVQHRRDIVFANMLTSIVSALLARFWCQRIDVHQMTRFAKLGCLAQFEGLLSCHGDEIGMLEDMMVAIDELARVTFRLEGIDDVTSVTSIAPTIEGSRLLMTVNLPVPEALLSTLSPEISKGFAFHVTPAFFNVGINEQATIAERETCNPSCMQSVPLSARKSITCMHAAAAPNSTNRFGDVSLQDKINADGLQQLREFHNRFRQVPLVADKARRPSICESTASTNVSELLDKLSGNVLQTKKGKNVEILHTAALICRLLNGLRFTSCKSAKDRTSMSVTLEQCHVLRENFDLAEHEFLRALECMRCEGTRRENTLKNAGVKKYAFNALQVMALPKLYRPPTGTYGNVQS